ncbi:MAG: TRAM domain-containing protein [Spirochaetes bacterium]|nr:TRAM domain-containing protein [Spirochaetota bacterium]
MFFVEIEKIVQGGFGIGRVQGKVIFVPYTLPGERVQVETTKARKDYEIAQTFHILQPSPYRITSLCPYFPQCGGCQFHHIGYDTELGIKREMFQETLRRITGLSSIRSDFSIGFIHSYPLACRNRVRLHFSEGQIGFLTAKGNSLVPIDRCIVCVEEINRFLQDVWDHRIPLRSSGEATVFGYGGNYFWEGGSREVTVELLGKQVSFPIDSFFQSNLSVLERLIQTHILPLQGSRILELYAGVGTFGVFLKNNCTHYTMVEEYPTSVQFARKNLGKGRVKVVQGKVEQWIHQRDMYDTVVIDPPRAGLSLPVREFLLRMSPKTILYISCNPVTFARDLKSFLTGGYEIKFCTLYDFYPRTTHLEVVCQLEKQ